jgi:hypothetical protein
VSCFQSEEIMVGFLEERWPWLPPQPETLSQPPPARIDELKAVIFIEEGHPLQQLCQMCQEKHLTFQTPFLLPRSVVYSVWNVRSVGAWVGCVGWDLTIVCTCARKRKGHCDSQIWREVLKNGEFVVFHICNYCVHFLFIFLSLLLSLIFDIWDLWSLWFWIGFHF